MIYKLSSVLVNKLEKHALRQKKQMKNGFRLLHILFLKVEKFSRNLFGFEDKEHRVLE